MKITLEVDRSPSLGPYSQNDEVTGTVRFQNDWSYITCIKVSLQGEREKGNDAYNIFFASNSD